LRLLHLGLSAASAASVFCLTIMPASADTVTVQPGQTLWSISQTLHVPIQSLESANPSVNASDLLVGTVLQVPSTGPLKPNTYVIQRGDTFWKIAVRYSISVTSLANANKSVNPANLLVGTTINIPLNVQSSSQNTSNQNAASVDEQNLYWMEHAIHAEADGEPLSAQIAVGDVIFHRMEAGTYGSTVKDVLFQVINGHYQFTCVLNGQIYSSPTSSNVQAADDVLINHEDVVPGALVFYNPAKTAASSWVWAQPTVAKISDFVFAK
jgi:N-acetylmuramoyl-L-alanine amidase